MSYFLTDQNLTPGQTAKLSGEESRHILLSRRMKVGERFTLQDPRFARYEAEVVETGKDLLEAKILREVPVPSESPVAVTLYQSYVQEKALDFILQKSTELGAARIALFNSANTGTRLSADQFISKSARWNKILWESAKQCDRAKIPELVFLPGTAEAVLDAGNQDVVYVLDIAGTNLKSSFLNLKSQPSRIGLVVGPEGGFTPLEISQFQSISHSHLISLGPLILRAETAALASLAICRELIN